MKATLTINKDGKKEDVKLDNVKTVRILDGGGVTVFFRNTSSGRKQVTFQRFSNVTAVKYS